MADVFGLEVKDLDEGWQAIEAVVLVKCLNPNATGNPYVLASRFTDGLTPWERVGMAECLKQLIVRDTFGGD